VSRSHTNLSASWTSLSTSCTDLSVNCLCSHENRFNFVKIIVGINFNNFTTSENIHIC